MLRKGISFIIRIRGVHVVVDLFSSARGESSAHHLRYTAQCACENKQPAMAYYVDRYVVINVGVRTRTRASSADLGAFSDRNVPRSSATQRAGKSTLVLRPVETSSFSHWVYTCGTRPGVSY